MALSPRDAYSLFEFPVERHFAAGSWEGELVPEDPDRVLLLFSSPSSARISLRPIAAGSPTTQGIIIVTAGLQFFQAAHGSLVGAAWFAAADPLVGGTVITLALRRWPTGDRKSGLQPGEVSRILSSEVAGDGGKKLLLALAKTRGR